MNVTIATGPWLPVPPVRGGAMQKVWHRLAREFVRLGHRVEILARRFPGQPDIEEADGLRIVRTRGFEQSGNLRRDLAKDLLYAIQALAHLPRSEILVTNDFWLPAITPRLRHGAGAVVVCAARYPKGQYGLYGGAARIVAISTAVRDAIVAERPALASRASVIPLPVETNEAASAASREHAALRTLLYVGRIHPEKGIDLLLRAFAIVAPRCVGWRLRIVGPSEEADGGGGSRYLERLRGLADGLDVELSDPVFDTKALAEVYAAADLFCYPSLADRGEAFGLAPLEAMAVGLPPIVSGLACFRDFIDAGVNGWVFEHRAADAAERLAGVLAAAMSDDATRNRLGARARSDAQRFSYPAIAQRYLDEFDRVLDSR